MKRVSGRLFLRMAAKEDKEAPKLTHGWSSDIRNDLENSPQTGQCDVPGRILQLLRKAAEKQSTKTRRRAGLRELADRLVDATKRLAQLF